MGRRLSNSIKGYGRRIFAAVMAFTLLGTVADTASVIKAAENKVKLQNPRISEQDGELDSVSGLRNPRMKMKVRDTITFGSYWQKDTNEDDVVDQKDEKQPVKWQVLSVNGDDVFLMSDKILGQQKYHTNSDDGSLTWGNSDIRQWLNGEFYNAAFDAEEQSMIKETTVVTEENETTKDKVYLLSLEEISKAEYGFEGSRDSDNYREHDEARLGKNASYYGDVPALANGSWWLRSYKGVIHYDEFEETQINRMYAAHVDEAGDVWDWDVRDGEDEFMGSQVDRESGVRPVLHIDLSRFSTEKVETAETGLVESEWDVVELGTYENKPVYWRVLSVENGDAFLLSDNTLTTKEYGAETAAWDKSTLRTWLNDSFYKDTFSQNERKGILQYTWTNDSNPWEIFLKVFGIESCGDTEDFVSLLSLNDVINKKYGFSTEFYGGVNMRKVSAESDVWEWRWNVWWLRSPGMSHKSAACIADYGTIYVSGFEKNEESMGVRPALHYDLANFSLKKVGTVRASIQSEGEFLADSTPTTVGKDKNDQSGNNPSDPSSTGHGISDGNNQKEEEKPSGNTTQNQDDTDLNKNTKSDSKPGKVVSLQGKNNKKKAVTLSWKKTAKAKKYQIQYSQNKKFKKAKTKTTTKTSYKVTKLKKKKTYYFRVRAVSKSGKKGAWSKTVKVKIKK